MFRWIVVLATVALAGCATDYRGYGYGYHDRYRDDAYVDGTTYYRGEYDSSGDYYYSEDYGYDAYRGTSWYDYPGYYSLFWGLNRSVFDPYWHPGFYYGVTYFPRDYFGISYYGGGWPRSYYSYRPYRSLWYSPYRYAWVDSYYDWYPYHYRYNHYRDHRDHYAPRYGNARNEAERLARWERRESRFGGLPADRGRQLDRDRVVRNPDRGADYYGQPRPRLDPGVRGFDRGVPADRRSADHGRPAGERLDPNVRGFDRPRYDERGAGRDAVVRDGTPRRPLTIDEQRRAADYGRTARDARPGGRDVVRSERLNPNVRGFDRDTAVPDWRTRRSADVERSDRGYTVRTPARPQNGYPLDGFRRGPAPMTERPLAAPQRPIPPPREYAAPARDRGGWNDLPPRSSPRESSALPPRQSPRYERSVPAQPQRSAPPPSYQRVAPPPAFREPPPSRAASYESRSEAREERREQRQDAREARSERRGRDDF